MDATQLFWGMVVSSVGLAYLVYGKRQRAPVPLLAGLALMGMPYFVDSVWLLIALACGIGALPFFITL
ncbi:hypothetical protein ACTSKR_01630 [Chitinibacteraceae bacterium HSL-7]